MKFSVASVIAAACVSGSSAFHVQPPMKQSTLVLNASRRAKQRASLTKWLDARGISDSTTATLEKAEAGMMTNDGGLDFIKLVHPDTGASADVYLYGGVVTSYKDGEGTEFIAVRPDAKMDGSKPISGGLSHCWPQFGPGEIQQHGFARNVMWEVKSSTDTTVELEMKPSDYTKEMWDKVRHLYVFYSFEVGYLLIDSFENLSLRLFH